mmetsp:Transcript_64855/g.154852  ORF Transcript_64855/g.154852 Transcript_64855/m.154852 type:complete len:210 (-) Transcript_64855:239-868(-)
MLMCVCYLRLGDRLEKRSCGALLSVATRTSSSSSMISAATAPEFVLPPDVAGNVEAAGPFSFLPPLLLSATALGMKSEPNPLAAGCFEASSAPPFRRYGSSSPTTAAFALALGCCSAASRGAADSGFAGAARFAAPAVLLKAPPPLMAGPASLLSTGLKEPSPVLLQHSANGIFLPEFASSSNTTTTTCCFSSIFCTFTLCIAPLPLET